MPSPVRPPPFLPSVTGPRYQTGSNMPSAEESFTYLASISLLDSKPPVAMMTFLALTMTFSPSPSTASTPTTLPFSTISFLAGVSVRIVPPLARTSLAKRWMMPAGMAIPVLGMLLGMLFAVFVSYRKPRIYTDRAVARVTAIDLDKPVRAGEMQLLADDAEELKQEAEKAPVIAKKTMLMAFLAIVLTLVAQLYSGSMILGGLVGFAVLSGAGIFKWQDADDVFVQGMRMMALVGFIMISAAGFASVMTATGDINQLVNGVVHIIGGNHALAAFLMLFIGLFVTIGIGSSFSSVPVLAVIYVPLCVQFGFSPLATVALIGTAAALGDAGSPASDSTLGPTAGLGVDGQHDHIWDTVIPTFIHFNIPLLIFGWIAAMVL